MVFFDEATETDNSEEAKYAFLAQDKALDADATDFSDPASIMRR